MTGTITYAKDELGKKACCYNIRYILPETSKSSSNKSQAQSESSSKETKENSCNSSLASTACNVAANINGTNNEPSTTSSLKDAKDKSKMKVDDYNEALVDFKINTLEKLGKNPQNEVKLLQDACTCSVLIKSYIRSYCF